MRTVAEHAITVANPDSKDVIGPTKWTLFVAGRSTRTRRRTRTRSERRRRPSPGWTGRSGAARARRQAGPSVRDQRLKAGTRRKSPSWPRYARPMSDWLPVSAAISVSAPRTLASGRRWHVKQRPDERPSLFSAYFSTTAAAAAAQQRRDNGPTSVHASDVTPSAWHARGIRCRNGHASWCILPARPRRYRTSLITDRRTSTVCLLMSRDRSRATTTADEVEVKQEDAVILSSLIHDSFQMKVSAAAWWWNITDVAIGPIHRVGKDIL